MAEAVPTDAHAAASTASDPRPCLVSLCPDGPTVGSRFPLGNGPVLLGVDAALPEARDFRGSTSAKAALPSWR